MGITVYFRGETITLTAGKDDLIIAISCSGATKITLTASSTAKEIGVQVVAVTSYTESTLGVLLTLLCQLMVEQNLPSPKKRII